MCIRDRSRSAETASAARSAEGRAAERGRTRGLSSGGSPGVRKAFQKQQETVAFAIAVRRTDGRVRRGSRARYPKPVAVDLSPAIDAPRACRAPRSGGREGEVRGGFAARVGVKSSRCPVSGEDLQRNQSTFFARQLPFSLGGCSSTRVHHGARGLSTQSRGLVCFGPRSVHSARAPASDAHPPRDPAALRASLPRLSLIHI